jgi:HJR/Mrr/RecB family endonuclease
VGGGLVRDAVQRSRKPAVGSASVNPRFSGAIGKGGGRLSSGRSAQPVSGYFAGASSELRLAKLRKTRAASMDWLFQCNPKRYDLAAFLQGGGTREGWNMRQGRNIVSPGDCVFFWQTGADAQLLAVGQVISPVYERSSSDFGLHCVDIAFEHKIVPPLRKDEVLANETLCNFRPFKGAMGTNFRLDDPAIIAELRKKIEGRLVPIPTSEELVQPIDAIKHAETAIQNATLEATNALRKYIAEMKPFTFELLVSALFLTLGYKDVVVTKRSGDSGIDVKAVLAVAGVGNIRTCIQVKRQQTPVGRPVVQNLRGSLGPHEVGIVVTSSGFSAEAREEAQDATKAPIALISGQQFAELLLKHQIGIRHIDRKLYRLTLDDLAEEKLHARVEGFDEGDA